MPAGLIDRINRPMPARLAMPYASAAVAKKQRRWFTASCSPAADYGFKALCGRHLGSFPAARIALARRLPIRVRITSGCTLASLTVLNTCPFALLLFAALWTATELPSPPQPAAAVTGPEWRHTSEGWIKVGASGAAGLGETKIQPVEEPAIHPAALSAFMLFGGLFSLAAFDDMPALSIPRHWLFDRRQRVDRAGG